MSFSKKSLLFLVLVVFIVIVSGAVFRYYENQREQSGYQTKYQKARELVSVGDRKGAVDLFRQAQLSATTADEEGSAKLNLGDLILIDNPPNGAVILKETADNTHYNNSIRAAAMERLLQELDSPLVSTQKRIGFANNSIFTDKWAEYLPSGNKIATLKEMRLAEIGALKEATDLYSLVQGEYTLAYLYSTDLPQKPQSALLQPIRDRLARGDRALETSQSSPSRIITGLIRKGQTLESLNAVGITQKPKDVEGIFKRALDLSENNKTNIPAQRLNNYTRFRLASWIARGAMVSRYNEIIATLDPIVSAQSKLDSVYPMFKSLKDKDWNGFGYSEDSVKLAKIDKSFAALLISLGWPEKSFQ